MVRGSTVVLFKDNLRKEVFLVFRSDYPCWVTTGGGIEPGETPQEAALREAQEETRFKIKIVRKVGEYSFKKNGIDYQRSYLFEGRVVSGKFRPEYPGCKGKWFEVDKLPSDTVFSSRELIVDCLSNQTGYFKKEKDTIGIKENLHLVLLHPLAIFKFFKVLINQVKSYIYSLRTK